MTKALTRKLERGNEVYNTDTGEVSRFVARFDTAGETVFIESMDSEGRFHVWTNKKTELL